VTASPVRAYVTALVLVTAGTAGLVIAFSLPWLTLAAVLGIVATRGPARRVVGALLVLAGLGSVVAALAPVASSGSVEALGAVGGVLVMLGGAWTLARGATWPAMGARYDGARPASRSPRPLSAWEAQDRGLDPTLDPTPDPTPNPTLDPTLDAVSEPIDVGPRDTGGDRTRDPRDGGPPADRTTTSASD
jgi:hypothetical protein